MKIFKIHSGKSQCGQHKHLGQETSTNTDFLGLAFWTTKAWVRGDDCSRLFYELSAKSVLLLWLQWCLSPTTGGKEPYKQRRGNQPKCGIKKKKEFWQICLGEHRLQHSKISENSFARRAKKSGQWPRNVYVAKDQMLLQQAMQVLWMDTGFIYLFHRGWDQVCGNYLWVCNLWKQERNKESSSVNLD